MFAGLPDSGLIILLGTPGSGKSTFASVSFAPGSVVGSDQVRELVAGNASALEHADAAFGVLLEVVRVRMAIGLLTVVDSTGSRRDVLDALISIAEDAGSNVTFIYLDLPLDQCLENGGGRITNSVPEIAVRRIFDVVAETACEMEALGHPVLRRRDILPRTGQGRRIFLGMPVTENIGPAGFRADKRRFYEGIHNALQFGGFAVESAAVNENYGAVNLEPSLFTRYDLDKIASADGLIVTTPSTLSPDVYLEIGLAIGGGKPVGLLHPAGGKFTAMMRGLIELGVVHRRQFNEDSHLPRMALELALELVGADS